MLTPNPNRKASAAAIEIPNGSTQGPSTVETAPPELSLARGESSACTDRRRGGRNSTCFGGDDADAGNF